MPLPAKRRATPPTPKCDNLQNFVLPCIIPINGKMKERERKMKHEGLPRFAWDESFFYPIGQLERAERVAEYLKWTGDSLTAYQLSKRFNCTPQTMNYTMNGFSRKCGISCKSEVHRIVKGNPIEKRLWYVNSSVS